MKRKVHWDDEEIGEGEMEPFEEAGATDVSEDEQSDDEEQRIKGVRESLTNRFQKTRF